VTEEDLSTKSIARFNVVGATPGHCRGSFLASPPYRL
jgi:hypothetical protein